MKSITIIIVLLLVGSYGFGQDRKLLSYSFTNEDSITVKISYDEIPNCIESERGVLQINIINDSVFIYHRLPKTYKIEKFSIINKDAFTYIFEFEKTGKKEESCGGYVGGNGVKAKLTINGSNTELFYCKDHWDGIEELILNIKTQNE